MKGKTRFNLIVKKLIIIQLILIFITGTISGQVRVRIFAGQKPSSAVFTVIKGKYDLDVYDGTSMTLPVGEPLIMAMFNGKIAIKTRNSKSFLCDSLIVKGITGNDRFSFKVSNGSEIRQFYDGDLQCISDLGIMVLINICDTEQYIAGVVRTEGGPGKNIEYLKSQAVLARTYTYKYSDRHIIDRYNLCDNIHCQAFKGISYDTLINRAVRETKGLVVLTMDSSLIISAFHSNCGGETSAPEDVWLSGYSYLKKVIDPYCVNSYNALWKKSVPVTEWKTYLKNSGFEERAGSPPDYNFTQLTRQNDYTVENFSLPFGRIREDLKLRSSFFSVTREGNSIIFKGRGYGHGVGLCQEGAMVMASRGFKFSDIIGFYYSGVIITDIKNAKVVKNLF